ncbi:MAG: hypothetical protein ACO31F_05845, partial [Ilumatobacteraceae bacterium]
MLVSLSIVYPFGTLTSRVANAEELLTNSSLEGTTGWTAADGWQTCSDTSGTLPCNDGSQIIFTRTTRSVTQCVNIANVTDYTSITASVEAAQYRGTTATDVVTVTLFLYGSNGCSGKMYQNGSSGNQTSTSASTVSVALSSSWASWSGIRSALIHIQGRAGETTDGNLGPAILNASLALSGGSL